MGVLWHRDDLWRCAVRDTLAHQPDPGFIFLTDRELMIYLRGLIADDFGRSGRLHRDSL